MALPRNVTFRLVAGDAFQYIIDYLDDDNVPIDLTGETITYVIYSGRDAVLTLTEGDGLTITAASGRIQINMTSAETGSLDGLLDRKHVLRLDTSETTIMVGRVEVFQSV